MLGIIVLLEFEQKSSYHMALSTCGLRNIACPKWRYKNSINCYFRIPPFQYALSHDFIILAAWRIFGWCRRNFIANKSLDYYTSKVSSDDPFGMKDRSQWSIMMDIHHNQRLLTCNFNKFHQRWNLLLISPTVSACVEVVGIEEAEKSLSTAVVIQENHPISF